LHLRHNVCLDGGEAVGIAKNVRMHGWMAQAVLCYSGLVAL
jgi:hypothetical protein